MEIQMSSYNFFFTNPLVNTGFVIVGAGLSRGQQMPPAGQYINPRLNLEIPGMVYTTGNGTQGFLRLYPRLNSQTTIPSSIPEAETLYIGWNIPEEGGAHITLTAPSLYKLSSLSSDGPFAFSDR
jgi:hypothetical protein